MGHFGLPFGTALRAAHDFEKDAVHHPQRDPCPTWVHSAWWCERRPPRHTVAARVLRQINRHLRGKSMRSWRYRDFASLVSLGKYTTVGNLMGRLVGGDLWIEASSRAGCICRSTARRTVPRVKLMMPRMASDA